MHRALQSVYWLVVHNKMLCRERSRPFRMCTDFANKLEVNDHPSVIYGNRVSRMLFDQYLALEGSFVK